MSQTRIKIVKTAKETTYIPQFRFLFFWCTYNDPMEDMDMAMEFSSLEDARAFIDKEEVVSVSYVDLTTH